MYVASFYSSGENTLTLNGSVSVSGNANGQYFSYDQGSGEAAPQEGQTVQFGGTFAVGSEDPFFQLLDSDNGIKNIYSTLAAAVDDAITADAISMGGSSNEAITIDKVLTIQRNGYDANLSADDGYALITTEDKYQVVATTESPAENTIAAIGFEADANDANTAINAEIDKFDGEGAGTVSDSDPNTMYIILGSRVDGQAYTIQVKKGDTEVYTATLPANANARAVYFTFEQDKGSSAEPDTLSSGEYTISLYAGDSATGEPMDTEKITLYQVSFNGNGGSPVPANYYVENGTVISKPADPTREGHTFNGWYLNGTAYDFTSTVTGDVVLTADWSNNNPSGGDPVTPSTYTITNPTVTGGKVTVSPRSASRGRLVTLTVTPDEGYELASLTVTDGRGNTIALTDAGNGKYTFTMPASRVVVNAAFQLASLPFTDVAEGAWYYDAVAYVYRNGLMSGVTADRFAPDYTLDRATLATILWRLAGEPVVDYLLPFEDVPEGEWYSEAIRWAASTGIVTGTTPTTFRPTQAVTREQMAAMVHRYADYMGYDTTASSDMTGFTDAESVNDYAVTPMSWSVAEGLISGIGTEIRPQSSATRAQIATMLMRLCESVAE